MGRNLVYLPDYKLVINLEEEEIMAKQRFEGKEELEIVQSFTLPRKKILVKPVIWKSEWLPKGHSAAWKPDNTKIVIQVPIDHRTNGLVEPLTELEREFFESEACGLGFDKGDLLANKYITDKNGKKVLRSHWSTENYKLYKKGGVIDDDTVLDTLFLDRPADYLKYAILRCNTSTEFGCVAPTWEDRFRSAKFMIALVDHDFEETTRATKADRLATAYAHYVSISHSSEKMREFLTVAWMENARRTRPDVTNNLEWLKSECSKLIETDAGTSYMKIAETAYEEKAFIYQAWVAGAVKIQRDGYYSGDGTYFGPTMVHAINYLNDLKNQEMKMKIMAQIKN